MRILMLTSDHLMIDRRILQSAKTLIDAGASVRLLAGFECPKEEAYDIGEIHVERNVFDWHDTRVRRIMDKLPIKLTGNLRTLAWVKLRDAISKITKVNTFEHFIMRKAFEQPFDVVHVHDYPMLSSGLHVARRANAPIVYDAHELYHAQAVLPEETQKIYRATERKLIREVDVAITVNPFIAAEMAKDYHIPQPNVLVNAMPYKPVEGKGIRDKFGWDKSIRIVMYQGWMSAERGIDKLVRAAAHFPPNVRLVLVGYGAVEDELKKISEEQGTARDGRVVFFGRVEPEDLAPLTAEADLGVIPYEAVDLNHYYCSPNKLFEFVMAGVPFVANDLPYLRLMCETHGIGQVVDLKSEEALARAVREILGDEKRYAEMREAAVRARKVLNWEVEGAKLVDLYNQKISPRIGQKLVTTSVAIF
ncbi:MAG TPA: glycosyltransferase family 4 protein [Hyphomonadaceae bacterium]|jgi:glycosyltransferase involved in cell wall biosynthesis|nr:glycosyltransferase family 4 protein [Hyphomonadaceae bacterium]